MGLSLIRLHHGYVSIYCEKHEEQLLKFFPNEVCRSATERCPCVSRGNRNTF